MTRQDLIEVLEAEAEATRDQAVCDAFFSLVNRLRKQGEFKGDEA